MFKKTLLVAIILCAYYLGSSAAHPQVRQVRQLRQLRELPVIGTLGSAVDIVSGAVSTGSSLVPKLPIDTGLVPKLPKLPIDINSDAPPAQD